MQPLNRKIIIFGDFNFQSCPLSNVSNFPLKGIKHLEEFISGKITKFKLIILCSIHPLNKESITM